MPNKKLIEVALPLEAINAESAREKSIRHGHPSTLHLWWARRPLATARAVIWASLVDDPSSHPELFPTEEEQNAERQRLFAILQRLVEWENSNDEQLLQEARAEIAKYTDHAPLALLDPFAGGGAIPLEAQRLGLEAHAHDLNPVAVMINKAMIEIPPRFAGLAPVHPQEQKSVRTDGAWKGAKGLAEDVRYYGEWMKQEAFRRIGHLYPKVKVPAEQGGGEATVIAWIWARTVKCPNPACGCEMPLASSFVLSKKKGKEAWVEPQIDYIKKQISYKVNHGLGTIPASPKISRGAKFKCALCGETTLDDYIKQESKEGRMGASLIAVVAEGKEGRIYLSPDAEQSLTAACVKPANGYPEQELPYDPRNIWCVNYGLNTYDKLFTNRQLTALTTFSDLVAEARQLAEQDAVAAGMKDDHIPLSEGGSGARAYGEAVSVYLAFAVDKAANLWSSLCGWMNDRGAFRETFARQAIPMTWDYAEANPFSDFGGNFIMFINRCSDTVSNLPYIGMGGNTKQFDAQSDCGLRNVVVSTDPPYYDNIGYADLSDFFYVWMRRSLKSVYPDFFRTLLVPKAEELVATPYRFEGSAERAKEFFEDGMLCACRQIYQYAREDVPVTIYYAYKQSDTESDEESSKVASAGWETMLTAIIRAGFVITGTWPVRTESPGRTIAQGTNALASSIVLVCRKRPQDAPQTTRRNFVAELKRELRPALQKLQRSNIAPVDLAQSAIGPGMGVYSKYARVLEADGTDMTVRGALQIINQELDVYFNEQDGDLDANSRFCVELYMQSAFNDIKFGDADTLARAKNTSVAQLVAKGMLFAQKGSVHLLTREEIPPKSFGQEKPVWLFCQQLTRAMETGGVMACAEMLKDTFGSIGERAKELAYRLYTIAERKGWTQEGYAYNALIASWGEIQQRAAELRSAKKVQISFFDEE